MLGRRDLAVIFPVDLGSIELAVLDSDWKMLLGNAILITLKWGLREPLEQVIR